MHGRIIDSEARCPVLRPSVRGSSNMDETFRYVRMRMLRCHNGTEHGEPKPGPCRTPEEIDRLVVGGSLTLSVYERDMDAAAVDPFEKLRMFKKTLQAGVHATCDSAPQSPNPART
eukprot:1620846-Prymnesium_polylepis.1